MRVSFLFIHGFICLQTICLKCLSSTESNPSSEKLRIISCIKFSANHMFRLQNSIEIWAKKNLHHVQCHNKGKGWYPIHLWFNIIFFFIFKYTFYNGMRCRCFRTNDEAYTSKYTLLSSKSTFGLQNVLKKPTILADFTNYIIRS
jgi:hypothetical protein